jgi:hypothetical protein
MVELAGFGVPVRTVAGAPAGKRRGGGADDTIRNVNSRSRTNLPASASGRVDRMIGGPAALVPQESRVAEVLPLLCLHGLSTGDFRHLSTSSWRRISEIRNGQRRQ